MPTFNHSTVNQFLAALRSAYKDGSKLTCVKIAKYVLSQGLTDNQLKNLFNVNDAQLPALKSRLQAQSDMYDSVKAAQGQ